MTARPATIHAWCGRLDDPDHPTRPVRCPCRAWTPPNPPGEAPKAALRSPRTPARSSVAGFQGRVSREPQGAAQADGRHPCPQCGTAFPLDDRGRIPAHRVRDTADQRCTGSDTRPAEETR